MSSIINKNFAELPLQQFIGGNSETYLYEMVDENNIPLDLSGATAKFTLAHYSTKTVILSKTCEIVKEENDVVHYPYKIQVRLDTVDTIALHGEFIQQITITDFFGRQKLPAEGRIIIIRNNEPIETDRFWYNDVQDGSFFATPAEQLLPVNSSYNINLFYISKTTQKLTMPVYSGLNFATTNPAIAEVSNTRTSSGCVTAIGVGRCDIYVAVTAKPEIFAKVAITVEQPNTKWFDDIKTGTFSASPSTVTLPKWSCIKAVIFYTSKGVNTSMSPPFTELYFETNNEFVATVDSNGLIYAVEQGTCVITAKVYEKPSIQTQITVTVT